MSGVWSANRSSQPGVVDLSCGAGGLSFGMQQARHDDCRRDSKSYAAPMSEHITVTSEWRRALTAQYCVLDIETAGPIAQPPDTYELLFTGIKVEQRHTIFRSNCSELELLAAFIDDFKGIVVTFNGSRFDLPIFRHALQVATGRTLRVSHHYDILLSIVRQLGRRISLDALARENLGIGKSWWDHGRNQEIWRSSPERLITHNQEDLDLTARLFELVLQRQPLKVDGKSILLPLDPSKPLR